MSHVVKHQKGLITRLRRIKGQVTALETLLEAEPECNTVLQQIAAIRGATNGLMVEVLDGHLRQHFSSDSSSEQDDNDLEQVLKVLKTYLK